MVREVMQVFKEKLYTKSWVEDVIKTVRQEIQTATASTEEIFRPLRSALAKADREIEGAERRLVRIPEDSLGTFLSELDDLKGHRRELQKQIAEAEKLTSGVIDLDAQEGKIRARLENFWTIFVSPEAGSVRLELAKHIERIEVSPERVAKLFPKPDGLLTGLWPQVRMGIAKTGEAKSETAASESGHGGIPRGI